MARSRSNGITGTNINLNTYFYKSGELEDPSSIKLVEILTKTGSVIRTYYESEISSLGTGIKKLSFNIPNDWEQDHYFDKWYYVAESGLDSAVQSNEFVVREAIWEQKVKLSAPNYSLKGELDTEKFSLYEKKYIKFRITDALNNLKNIDSATVMLKDYDGSNLYVLDSAITDEKLVYYYFNSSSLQALYPEYIDRSSVYEWVLEIKYRGDILRVNPIEFSFSV